MRVLIYKRTHNSDPDASGHFGIDDSMGRVRSYRFDAVIGLGGVGAEAKSEGIAGKLNWIGIGSHRIKPGIGIRSPIISFDHFKYFGTDGPELANLAPALADRMYGRGTRLMIHIVEKDDEVAQILALAESAPSSSGLRKNTRRQGERAKQALQMPPPSTRY